MKKLRAYEKYKGEEKNRRMTVGEAERQKGNMREESKRERRRISWAIIPLMKHFAMKMKMMMKMKYSYRYHTKNNDNHDISCQYQYINEKER